MTILTPDRIAAMSFISRWGGWVKGPWSVLDHTLAGAFLMQHQGKTAMQIRAWLLHDVEETAFMGDVPTPYKARYCNDQYRADVAEFVQVLYEETNTAPCIVAVKETDEIILRAEYALITSKVDPEPRMDENVLAAMAMIRHLALSSVDRSHMFWQLWVAHDPHAHGSNVVGMGSPRPGNTH